MWYLYPLFPLVAFKIAKILTIQEQKIAISAGAVVITCVATACQKYIQSRYAMSLSVVPTGNALRAEILTSFGANSKSYTIEG